jgi:hypothetical protein
VKSNSYIPASAQFALDAAAKQIDEAFDCYGVFLVGSCLHSKDYRDVDVRCVVADDIFDEMFPLDPESKLLRPKWQLLCLALSSWMRSMTGLPIDFQFQKISLATERYKSEQRHPLGLYSFVGDATI